MTFYLINFRYIDFVKYILVNLSEKSFKKVILKYTILDMH